MIKKSLYVRPTLKYIVASIIILPILFALSISPVPGPLLSIPGLQKDTKSSECALVGRPAGDYWVVKGFPFRVNQYGICGVGEIKRWIAGVNLIVLTAGAFGTYRLAQNRLDKVRG